MNESSFGSAAPKNRSINVGANLLGEWIAERSAARRNALRLGAVLGASVLVAAVALPVLWRAGTAASRQAAALRSEVKGLDDALAASGSARKAAQPSQAVATMRVRTGDSFERLLGGVGRVLAAGGARTALATLHGDVQGGNLHLLAQADAEDDLAVEAFARAAGEPAAKVDAITGSRPSPLLGPRGISFQYEKRISVAP